MIKAELKKKTESGSGATVTIEGRKDDILREYIHITKVIRGEFSEFAVVDAVCRGLVAYDEEHGKDRPDDSDKDFIKSILKEILK